MDNYATLKIMDKKLKTSKYWIKPFLIEFEFIWAIGLIIGYDKLTKRLVVLIPFCAIEIQYIKVNH